MLSMSDGVLERHLYSARYQSLVTVEEPTPTNSCCCFLSFKEQECCQNMPVLLRPPKTDGWVCFSGLRLGRGLRILSEQKSYTLTLVLLISLLSLFAFTYLWEGPLDLSVSHLVASAFGIRSHTTPWRHRKAALMFFYSRCPGRIRIVSG